MGACLISKLLISLNQVFLDAVVVGCWLLGCWVREVMDDTSACGTIPEPPRAC